jgi:hypothetical protein
VRNPVARQRARLLREQLEREAWIGQQFLRLLEQAAIVTLHNGGDEYRADVIDPRGRTRSVTEGDLRDLLLRVSGVEWTKTCHGPCGRTLPIEHFGHDRNKPDGRLLRCKKCEAERVRQYKGKKRP